MAEKSSRSVKTTLDMGREQTNESSKQTEKLVVDSNSYAFPDAANIVPKEKHTPNSVGSEPKLYRIMKINTLQLTLDAATDLKHQAAVSLILTHGTWFYSVQRVCA